MSDYYNILNVDKDASQTEIKKAYRKLSMKWHPDRNKSSEAESQFKSISEAYTVLSDEKSRQEYDMMEQGINLDIPDLFKVFMGSSGSNIFPGMMNPQEFNFFNQENNDFNIKNIFQNLRKPPPIINNITITLEDAYNGLSVPLSIEIFPFTVV